MLQSPAASAAHSCSFDLAPTGALCYSIGRLRGWGIPVLISLPQERCATTVHASLGIEPVF